MDLVRFAKGIELFNRAEFFEAHEILEDVWRECQDPEKKFLQALIQSAVALHHHSRGNLAGARSLLGRSSRNLQDYPEIFAGINVERLRRDLEVWSLALESEGTCPAFPRLELDSRDNHQT